MGFVVCDNNINLVMVSVTRKGRVVCFEPSQYHGLFLFYGGENESYKSREMRKFT